VAVEPVSIGPLVVIVIRRALATCGTGDGPRH